MKPFRYQPEEVAVLEQFLDKPFPHRLRHELLPHRSVPSINQRLNMMRRKAGTLWRVPSFIPPTRRANGTFEKC